MDIVNFKRIKNTNVLQPSSFNIIKVVKKNRTMYDKYAYGSCHRTKYRAERIFHWQTPFCASTLKYNYLLPFRVIGHLNALAACKRQKHIFRLTGQARLIHENQPPHARFFDTQFCLTLYTDAVGGLNSCLLMHKNSSVYKRKGAKKKSRYKGGR